MPDQGSAFLIPAAFLSHSTAMSCVVTEAYGSDGFKWSPLTPMSDIFFKFSSFLAAKLLNLISLTLTYQVISRIPTGHALNQFHFNNQINGLGAILGKWAHADD